MWTQPEETTLRVLVEARMSLAEIMRQLGKSKYQINQKVRRMKMDRRGTQNTNAWTKSEDDLLRTLHAEGRSAAICADHLPGRSRNAIIGRWHRIGLSEVRRTATPRVHKPRVQRAPRERTRHLSRIAPLRAPRPEPDTILRDQIWTFAFNRVHLMDLKPRHCRWPVGGLFFCGGGAEGSGPYCGSHQRLALRHG